MHVQDFGQVGRVGGREGAGKSDVPVLLRNGMQSAVKRVGIGVVIGVRPHDGLGEVGDEVRTRATGGRGQASHDKPQGLVVEINPLHVAKEPLRVELNDLGKLCRGQAGDAAVAHVMVVPNARPVGTLITSVPVLIDTVASGPQQGTNGSEEGALIVDTVAHSRAGRGDDQVVEMGA
jgi:hypothetical protein